MENFENLDLTVSLFERRRDIRTNISRIQKKAPTFHCCTYTRDTLSYIYIVELNIYISKEYSNHPEIIIR